MSEDFLTNFLSLIKIAPEVNSTARAVHVDDNLVVIFTLTETERNSLHLNFPSRISPSSPLLFVESFQLFCLCYF